MQYHKTRLATGACIGRCTAELTPTPSCCRHPRDASRSTSGSLSTLDAAWFLLNPLFLLAANTYRPRLLSSRHSSRVLPSCMRFLPHASGAITICICVSELRDKCLPSYANFRSELQGPREAMKVIKNGPCLVASSGFHMFISMPRPRKEYLYPFLE